MKVFDIIETVCFFKREFPVLKIIYIFPRGGKSMAKKLSNVCLFFLISSLVFCCWSYNAYGELKLVPGVAVKAKQENTSIQACFDEKELKKIDVRKYVQKVDNFLIIFDPSVSMSENYQKGRKFEYAKCLLRRMNKSIPEIPLKGSLRTFGVPAYTSLIYGIKEYSPIDFDIALQSVKASDGASPLEFAIRAATKDFETVPGKTAIIIVTDGKGMDVDVLVAAREMKRNLGQKVCIYAILIGNDPAGKKLLENVVKAGLCGFLVNGDALNSGPAMIEYVKKIFLSSDSDSDGVADNIDNCPDTPNGARVGKEGCWLIGLVLFDFDKFDINPQYYSVLDEVYSIMLKNPDLRIKIEGHTDIVGSERYNKKLSIKRAMAGKAYLVKKGISSGRIMTIGYGYSMPRAPSETVEDRSMNRRIEFRPVR